MPKSASSTGPDYYKATAVEPWTAMEAWLTREEFIGFLKGNAIKYLARASHKGQHDSDTKKAEHYLQKLNEVLRDG